MKRVRLDRSDAVAVARDIAERKRSEAALRQSEDRYRDLVEHSQDLLCTHDLEGRLLSCNPAPARILGYDVAELLKIPMRELIAPEYRAQFEQYLARIRTNGADKGLLAVLTRTGERRIWEYNNTLRTEGVPSPIVRGMAHDITEHRRAQAAALRLAAVVESSDDAIISKDLNGVITSWNAAAQRIFGYSEKEALGQSIKIIIPRARLNEETEILRRLQSGEHIQHYETIRVTKQGKSVHVSLTISPIMDAKGRVVGASKIARDITGRKRAEKQLQRSTAYLAEAQRLSHTGSWGFTVAGGEVFWSEETFRIFGLDAAKIKPTRARFFQCLHPEDRPLIEAVEAELGAGKDLEFDYRIIRPDRSVRYIHSQAHPVVDESGTLIEFIGTVMDVTERRRAEEALRESQAALARVSRVAVLGELTASIAHEINQPLAAVVTNGSAALRWLATRPPNLDEVREALRRVIREANRTGDVVERIRALLKKKPPQMQALHMNAVIREVLSSVDNELRTGGITIQTELAADIPMVLGDRVQLQEVMLNLILNSIDAMSALADRPRYLLITSTKDCEGVLVQVQDSGKGLDPRQVHKIFEPFFSTKPEGIGLGLSISRSIIEAHGGRLWATSGSPHGAVFQFILPEQVVPHD